MASTPRLTAADRADLAARHQLVTARVMAAEDIARQVIREPVDDATRHLIARLAMEPSNPASIKRAVFSGVHVVSGSLADAAANAVGIARHHARSLAGDQAATDLAGFMAQAESLGFAVSTQVPPQFAIVTTTELDGAISNQAGLAIAHRWSSSMLGSYVTWKRNSGGVDGLMRSLSDAGNSGLGGLLETQAITQSVDAYADQHALTWRRIAEVTPGTLYETGGEAAAAADAVGWGAGLFDVWSAILDRGTCARCADLDGDMVRVGEDWGGDGRPPLHLRCRCEPISLWVPDAAMQSLPGAQLDYEALKGDVAAYMKGASLNLGEGRRHAQEFYAAALAGHSPTVLAGLTSNRRAYFPNRVQQRAPRLF